MKVLAGAFVFLRKHDRMDNHAFKRQLLYRSLIVICSQ